MPSHFMSIKNGGLTQHSELETEFFWFFWFIFGFFYMILR